MAIVCTGRSPVTSTRILRRWGGTNLGSSLHNLNAPLRRLLRSVCATGWRATWKVTGTNFRPCLKKRGEHPRKPTVREINPYLASVRQIDCRQMPLGSSQALRHVLEGDDHANGLGFMSQIWCTHLTPCAFNVTMQYPAGLSVSPVSEAESGEEKKK